MIKDKPGFMIVDVSVVVVVVLDRAVSLKSAHVLLVIYCKLAPHLDPV